MPDEAFDEAEELSTLQVKLYIGMTELAVKYRDDERLDEIREQFQRNPKHMIRAYDRWPSVFNANEADSLAWYDIVGAWDLGGVEDDEVAKDLFNQWHAYTWDLAQLKEHIKATKQKRKRQSLKEQCKELVARWRGERDDFTCDPPFVFAPVDPAATCAHELEVLLEKKQ